MDLCWWMEEIPVIATETARITSPYCILSLVLLNYTDKRKTRNVSLLPLVNCILSMTQLTSKYLVAHHKSNKSNLFILGLLSKILYFWNLELLLIHRYRFWLYFFKISAMMTFVNASGILWLNVVVKVVFLKYVRAWYWLCRVVLHTSIQRIWLL